MPSEQHANKYVQRALRGLCMSQQVARFLLLHVGRVLTTGRSGCHLLCSAVVVCSHAFLRVVNLHDGYGGLGLHLMHFLHADMEASLSGADFPDNELTEHQGSIAIDSVFNSYNARSL